MSEITEEDVYRAALANIDSGMCSLDAENMVIYIANTGRVDLKERKINFYNHNYLYGFTETNMLQLLARMVKQRESTTSRYDFKQFLPKKSNVVCINPQ